MYMTPTCHDAKVVNAASHADAVDSSSPVARAAPATAPSADGKGEKEVVSSAGDASVIVSCPMRWPAAGPRRLQVGSCLALGKQKIWQDLHMIGLAFSVD